MNKIKRTQLIDRYLSNEMSEEEKVGFEKLLSEADSSSNNEPNLRKEMELQQQIENAIRERGLREMLQEEEQRIRRKQKIKRTTIWSLCGGGVISAIAAVMLILFVSAPATHILRDYSTNYISQMEVGVMRGSNEYLDMLDDAVLLMQKDEWKQAYALVQQVYDLTSELEDEQTIEIYNEAEWLKALYLMHEEDEGAAKALLNKIANSDSFYRAKADEILKQL